jgi:protein-L-isoaspartate(D-aspartate) O-methyltransferase
MEATPAIRERSEDRNAMVEWQLARRGVRDAGVLRAMREVPREAFVPPEVVEFAYEDSALPIGEGQTISQPYIVALMLEALELEPESVLLDVGTGSGYAAAVASRIAARVYTIERHRTLAERAQEIFRWLGYDNVEVRVGDGSLGWPEAAPFEAIAVAAAGPKVPQALLEQLADGGRLVIPTGPEHEQHLQRIRRTPEGLVEDDLGAVRFVPLIGAGAWPDASPAVPVRETRRTIPERIRAAAEPIPSIDDAGLDPLLERIGDARVVLLGEATHGTSEFYRMRGRITRELVERAGFRIVAIEADWPDAARVDAWIRGHEPAQPEMAPFSRFPTWMWRNEEMQDLLRWMRSHNERRAEAERAGLYGLDLYSLYGSLDAVLRYLDDVDVEAAAAARTRYGCLTPWSHDPASYGRAAITGRYRECEADVVATLRDLLARRLQLEERDGRRFFEAERNATLVANAERYYRIMYYGSNASWNLRDQHMFDTLLALLEQEGPDARAVVWAHNSHLGDASATEMGARGQHNVGQLARRHFGDGAYLVGFGTHAGTVAAADDWGEPMQVMRVTPSHERSYERLCHDAGAGDFLLPLRDAPEPALTDALRAARLERAIGVVYRPETEMESHYFQASLPAQFDEYVWFDETRAVTPLTADPGRAPAETFPFGL